MSIFLRPGQIKVRDDTGEFTSINVMAETSANEIINDIEAAGREVIESIPADYTALTEEVGELNERLMNSFGQKIDEIIENPASGTKVVDFAFDVLKNQPYLLSIRNTTNSVIISTRNTSGGSSDTNIERLYAGGETTMVVIPAYDAKYVRFVSTKGADFTFQTLTPKLNYDTIQSIFSDISGINTELSQRLTNYSALINSTTHLADLNDINNNVCYRLNFAVNATSIPSNTPYGALWKSSTEAFVLSHVKTAGSHSAGDYQLFVGSDGVYVRSYTTTWLSWVLVASIENSVYTKNTTSLINGTGVLSDLDNVTENASYRLNFSVGSSSIPAHTPYGSSWKSTIVAFFVNVVKTTGSHTAGDYQLFIGSDGIYARYYATSWLSWNLISNKSEISRIITVDANGNGDYTSLCEGIYEALTLQNAKVIVKRGTYDAIAEMKAIHGNDYFDTFTANSTDQIFLLNGISIVCEPGTEMVCDYEGNNENVNIYFSPLNFGSGDAYIEGLTIKSFNTRYCIHDDRWNSIVPYRHILKNCSLIIDNSDNANWDRRLAFGGGLGVNAYIEFDGCYFESVDLDGTTAYSGWGTCGFHNSPSENAQSLIVVKNCYFADGSTFRLTYFGSSTLITTALVSACSLGRDVEVAAESGTAHINNVRVIKCANEIRSS